MKILFMFALLINIIIFLWEYNRGTHSLQANTEVSSNVPKQILLLAEVEAEKNNGSTTINMDRIYALSELMIPKNTDFLPKLRGSDHIVRKDSIQLIKKTSEASLKKAEVVKNKVKNNQKPESSHTKSQKQNKDSLKANDDKKQKIDPSLEAKKKADIKKTKAVCYQIGPFVSARSISRWGKRNKIHKDSLHRISKDKKLNNRYLVYYPAAKTFSQSKENVQMLRKKGIAEYWLIRRGASKGAISLGFFVREESAHNLQKRLFEKGLKVYIKQKFDKKPVYFAQVLSSDQKFKDTLRIKKNQSISSCNDDRR